MHVCVIYGYGFNASGSAIYNMNFAEALRREGHTVTMTCHETRQALIEQMPGFKTRRTPWGWELKGDRLRIESHVDIDFPVSYARPELDRAVILSQMSVTDRQRYVRAMHAALERIHAATPIDVLVVHHLSLLAMIVADFARKHGIPHEVIVHGTGLEYALKPDELLREMVGRALAQASSIIALNADVKRRVVEQLPGLAGRVEIVPPGVNFERFERAPGRQSSGRQAIGYVGRMTMDKGVHALMVAFVQMVERCPDVRLELYGSGPDEAALRAVHEAMAAGDIAGMRRQLEATGRDGRSEEEAACLMAPLGPCWAWLEVRPELVRRAACSIRFHGYVDQVELASCYHELDLVVLPSIVAEAFPLVLLEALACGVPAVASDRHGQGWFLKSVEEAMPEVSGRLRFASAPGRRVASMVETCVSMLTISPGERFVREVREFLEMRYAWGPITRSIIEAGAATTIEKIRGAV